MALAGPRGAGPREPVSGPVPCPLCGGLIHPVAGRCKHCKQDLGAYRGAPPAAAAALPAIPGPAAAPGAARSLADAARARDGSVPARSTAPTGTAVAPASAWWRSWPRIAIGISTVAIVVALVVRLWPRHEHPHDPPAVAPPAPTEHMDTDPEPEQPQPDPWASPQGRADPAPAAPAPAPRPDPDPPAIATSPPRPQVVPPAPVPQPAPQAALPDPLPANPPGGGVTGGIAGGPAGGGLGGLGGLGGGLGQLGNGGSTFMLTALAHACARLETCPDPDASLSTMCDAFATLPTPPPPAGCAPAQRCLDAIDHLSCSQAAGDMPTNVLMMFQDCSTAMTSC